MTHQHDAQSTGELISRISADVSRLVRDELALAKLELRGKAQKAGVGVGMFGAAGLLAVCGLGVLIAAAVLALALAMPAWLAALIVGVVLLAIAGVVALVGRERVGEATPPMPERALESVRRDVDAVRRAGSQG